MKYFVFDDILCINLDRRPDRWEKVQKDFSSVGMQLTRIPAVYGKSYSRKELKRFTSKGCAYFCPKSAIGCAMSHRRAWQTIVDKNLESALILEDDAYPLPRFEEKLKNVWSQVPKDWDIVYLGGRMRDFPSLLKGSGLKFSEYISKNVMIPGFPFTAHAYAVSNKGAKKILEKTNPVRYHIDFHLAMIYQKNRDINVYTLKPELIRQIDNTEYSDNQFSTFKPIDTILKNFRIGDEGLDNIANVCLFSIGDFDFTGGRIFIVILLIVITYFLFKIRIY